jgi:NADH-ubiquinone oxidoreductase chain 5
MEAECAPVFIKQIPLFFTVAGAAVSISFIYYNPIFAYNALFFYRVNRIFYTFFNHRWLFDRVYNESFAKAFLFFGYIISFRLVDKGALEVLGPYGFVFFFPNLSKQLLSLQSGRVYNNVLFIVYGLGFLICSPLFFSANGCFFLISVGCWVLFRVFLMKKC